MLEWSGTNRFSIDGVKFLLIEPFRPRPHTTRFVLLKPRWMLDRYAALAPELRGGNVVELGIFEGGSTAFFAQLLRPRRLVALELDPEPKEVLAEFIQQRQLGQTVRPYYGVDQADRGRLEEIVDDEFGEESLDLVIDDASHNLAETLVSFHALFPRLRPGGAFVIEDWSWDHTWERMLRSKWEQIGKSHPPLMARLEKRILRSDPSLVDGVDRAEPDDRAGLSRLLVDLVLACGYSEHVVAELTVCRGFALVRRGDAEIDRTRFDIAACYEEVGRRILA